MDGTGGTSRRSRRVVVVRMRRRSHSTSKKASRKKAKRSKQRASGILQLSAKAGTGMIEQLLMMVVLVVCLLPAAADIDTIANCKLQIAKCAKCCTYDVDLRKLYNAAGGSQMQQLDQL